MSLPVVERGEGGRGWREERGREGDRERREGERERRREERRREGEGGAEGERKG